MKRGFFYFLLLFFISVVWAQPVSVGIFGSIPVKKDFTNQDPAVELLAEGNYFNFETDAGLKISTTQLNFTTTGYYMPQLFLDGLRIGGGFGYHHLKYEDIFDESNYLISARVRYTTKKEFCIEAAYNFFMINTEIYSIKNSVPSIFNWNTCIDILMSKVISDKFKYYFNITSYDYFDYPYLGVPFIKTGFEYCCFSNVTAIMDCTIKLEDMFTSTTYVSGCYVNVGVKTQIW